MDKKFWGILGSLIVIAIVVAIIFGGNNSSNAEPTSHIKGSDATGVKLVEYGDFQCPACGDWYPIIEQVMEKYKDKIQFQFRNFPLSSMHPHAVAAARAAEAAGMQDKYWEMYGKIYQENFNYYASQESQQTWINADKPTTFFNRYAKSIGLDIDKFNKDYKSTKVNDMIQADRNAGTKIGVSGTPAFFLDGEKLDPKQLSSEKTNAPSVEAFSKLIDKAIEKKTGKKPQQSDKSDTNQSSKQPSSQEKDNESPQTKAKQ